MENIPITVEHDDGQTEVFYMTRKELLDHYEVMKKTTNKQYLKDMCKKIDKDIEETKRSIDKLEEERKRKRHNRCIIF